MNIWIFPLESVETRYTKQWRVSIPKDIKKFAIENNFFKEENIHLLDNPDNHFNKNDLNIISIDGDLTETNTSPGAFLDFGATNFWKSTQLAKFVSYLQKGLVNDSDKILITDAWNTSILQLKYMIELLPNLKNVKIFSLWHAGSYDPQDFLGRLIKDKNWVRHTEKGLFYSCDYNFFATNFHIDLFKENLFDFKNLNQDEQEKINSKIFLSGQPHSLLIEELEKFKNIKKENIVLFPHRIAPEKQPEIFKDLASEPMLKDYQFIFAQDKKLTKKEYHELLAKSKIIFSANLQETLGISAMEGILVNTWPMVPDRLSYKEMYIDTFLYPSFWTESLEAYKLHRYSIITLIKDTISFMDNNYRVQEHFDKQKEILLNNYLTANNLYKVLLNV